MAKPLSDKKVITALGGPSALTADLTDYSTHAITKWLNSKRGIPWKARVQIHDLAKKRRVPLPPDFLHVRRLPSSGRAA